MNLLRERLITSTRDLVLIPSSDDRPSDRERAFQFFLNHLQGIDNLELVQEESHGYESLIALPTNIKKPDILLCGHLDVVSHSGDKVYTSTIENGRIIGPGAGDMKGALAILLELFLNYHRENPGASLGLVITSDEEIGGRHGLRYLIEERDLRTQLAIIPDGGSLTEITSEEKGILHLKVTSRGEAAHAARPWLTHNALHRLIDGLSEVIRHFETLRPTQLSGRDHWYPTCSVSQIQTRNSSVNRIPDHVEATLDIRFPPPFSSAEMTTLINQLLKTDKQLNCTPLVTAEPTRLDPDPLFSELTQKVTGSEVISVRASGGSDARFLSAHGIPVILSRPLVGNLHAKDEWIDIASMEAYYQICHEFISARLTPLPSPPTASA